MTPEELAEGKRLVESDPYVEDSRTILWLAHHAVELVDAADAAEGAVNAMAVAGNALRELGAIVADTKRERDDAVVRLSAAEDRLDQIYVAMRTHKNEYDRIVAVGAAFSGYTRTTPRNS